jgi:hypothetical protein
MDKLKKVDWFAVLCGAIIFEMFAVLNIALGRLAYLILMGV